MNTQLKAFAASIRAARAQAAGAGQSNRRKQRGITLVELIAGLAIISIIIVGALALVGQADTAARSTEMLKGVNGIRANVKGLYTSQGGYGTTSLIANMKAANALPENWISGTSASPTLTHSYGGNVTVTGTASGSAFEITLSAVPKAACIRLLSNQVGTSWTSVKVGTTTVAFPITVATATTSCAADTNNRTLTTS
jgi:prepilin-type N-terminal cleavage/methylation domain-containing protein